MAKKVLETLKKENRVTIYNGGKVVYISCETPEKLTLKPGALEMMRNKRTLAY